MLPKAYDPTGTEGRIYQMWEEAGVFRANVKSKKEPFTISLPPPNATGNLHLGHAVMLALEDIFIRFARMQGKEALWVPGTDHAAIATENVVIRELREQGMKDPRSELGREALVARIATFVEQSRSTINSQVRRMGASCDWSRERYTFEPALNRLVNEVFKKMYDDGLVYRGHRIVNWDPKLQTTVSDDEIVWVEETAPFYTFQYGPFQIGTVRPETKFGDKYVVMHPDDERYKKYKHGETLECEWINGPIRATIIKDTAVDPTFGTGVMTITPWHTAVDFDIAERHGLEKEQIIDWHGRLLPIAGEFQGMKIDDARPKIVEKLQKKGLLVKVDDAYVHRKATSQRGGGTIEPQVKLQWFVDVNKRAVSWKGETMSLKEVMHDVVHHGDIRIVPDRFEKVYFHWIDNLRDWCISRQIWWGHRVPVYYCAKCGSSVSVFPIKQCPTCKAPVEQDPDTLDTWFSSALWTWSTLIDPKLTEDPKLTLEQMLAKSPDFQKFHPTSVLETGYDILFFWVARMILMTTYAVHQVPFKTVYLHGLVRTREGKKMSKSDPSTMIDPLDIIQEFGADALRLSMIVGQSPGNDFRLYKEKIGGYRNFINKLWNASRFVLLECEKAKVDPHETELGIRNYELGKMSLADRAMFSALQDLINDVTDGLRQYRLSDVGERLYSFIWDFFCDWYLELSKDNANLDVLVHSLRTLLKLLHPYCPFVTEELWTYFENIDEPAESFKDRLIIQEWPKMDPKFVDRDAERDFQILIDIIKTIRKLRLESGIEPSAKVGIILHTDKHLELLQSQREHIMRMCKLDEWTLNAVPEKHENVASAFLDGIEIHLPLAAVGDAAGERERLEKEKADLERLKNIYTTKLSNGSFVARAPKEVVDAEQEKLRLVEEKLQKILERLDR